MAELAGSEIDRRDQVSVRAVAQGAIGAVKPETALDVGLAVLAGVVLRGEDARRPEERGQDALRHGVEILSIGGRGPGAGGPRARGQGPVASGRGSEAGDQGPGLGGFHGARVLRGLATGLELSVLWRAVEGSGTDGSSHAGPRAGPWARFVCPCAVSCAVPAIGRWRASASSPGGVRGPATAFRRSLRDG